MHLNCSCYSTLCTKTVAQGRVGEIRGETISLFMLYFIVVYSILTPDVRDSVKIHLKLPDANQILFCTVSAIHFCCSPPELPAAISGNPKLRFLLQLYLSVSDRSLTYYGSVYYQVVSLPIYSTNIAGFGSPDNTNIHGYLGIHLQDVQYSIIYRISYINGTNKHALQEMFHWKSKMIWTGIYSLEI